MRLKFCKISICLLFFICSAIHWQSAISYKTEIEITPAPDEEVTTKKSGFFGGIKNFFRGSPTPPTTTTALPPIQHTAHAPPTAFAHDKDHRPPPLTISNAPLVPLGPRPDTPSSPVFGHPQQQPQWPQPQGQPQSQSEPQPNLKPQVLPQSPFHGSNNSPTSRTTTAHPKEQPPTNPQLSGTPFGAGGPSHPNQNVANLPPGFPPRQSPKPLPSGLDLSYGGPALHPNKPQSGGSSHGFGLAPLTSSTTTTTTTTPRSVARPDAGMRIDLPSTATSTTLRPSSPTKEEFPPLPSPRRPSAGSKEEFPALPAPKSPTPIPGSPVRSSSPSAWNVPLSVGASTPHTNRVSFVPHASTTSTIRPGVEDSGNSLATDDEIRTLTEALYAKETNSLISEIQLNPQGKTRSIDSTDEAPQPLLQVSDKALDVPTVAKLRVLFNNYEQDTLTNEYVTPNEKKEENEFVDAVMATPIMRHAMTFLQNKGIVSPDPKTHRDLVKELWFTQYSRGSGKIGSSGFEHVFVNEVKNGTLIGLHNWVYFFEEEKANHLDYKGYMNQIDLGTKGKVMKVRFTFNGLNKPVNTLFVGTSPELELALYTICFQLRPDRTCPVSLGNSRFGIVTYSWRYRGKNLIGSAYPEI